MKPGSTFVFCICLFVCVRSRAIGGDLRAGLAKIDVTPTQPVKLEGYESRKEPSQGVHDPLGARAVAFESNGRHLVLVSSTTLASMAGPPNRCAIPSSRPVISNLRSYFFAPFIPIARLR